MHLIGGKIKYVPLAKFKHDSKCYITSEGKVVTNISRRKVVERQVICMMIKYYKLPIFIMFVFFSFWLIEAVLFLLINPRVFWRVYCGAIFWNINNFYSTLAKRRYIQDIRTVGDLVMMDKMNFLYAKLDGLKRTGVHVIK